MDGHFLYEFIGFGAMDCSFLYEFIGFGAIDGQFRWPMMYVCVDLLALKAGRSLNKEAKKDTNTRLLLAVV